MAEAKEVEEDVVVIVRVALKVSNATEGDAVLVLERLSVGEEDPDTVTVGTRGVAVALPPVPDREMEGDFEKEGEEVIEGVKEEEALVVGVVQVVGERVVI